ncbi:MAG: iron ABC transporter permease [Planctomycetes bacterium]|nr:iron ABC transporter permease [Planctomycetota bacterium]
MKTIARALAIAVPLACLAPPLALVADAVAAGTLGRLAIGSREILVLLRSLEIAAIATLFALVWGLSTAWAAARHRGAFGRAIELLSYVPLLLPGMVIVLGWVAFLGPAGVVARFLRATAGVERIPIDLFNPAGAGFVLSLRYFPCITILGAEGIRAMGARPLRAASLSAGPVRRAWSIGRPLLEPYIATGALIVFLLAFSDFAVPCALMVNVYPIEIFVRISSYLDPRGAILLALPPLAIAIALFAARLACFRSMPHARAGDEGPVGTRCPRPVSALALAAVALSSALPLTFLAVTAGSPKAFPLALETAAREILNSLDAALWATLVLIALAGLFAIGYRRGGRPLRRLAEALLILTLIVPGAAVGLGIIELRADRLAPAAGLVCAAACRSIIFPALILAQALVSVRDRIIQSGALCGAGRVRIARKLVLPLLLPSIASAAAISFVLALGELSAAAIVYPPGGMTLPVRLASLLHFGEDAVVAALCLMISAFAIGVVLLSTLIARRPPRLRLSHAD